jgi:predicted nucleic acid-binding protein
MRPRVFLDSNVFIYAYEARDSNSNQILDMLSADELEAVVSERVLSEVWAYFRRHHGREKATELKEYILESCTMIYPSDIRDSMKLLRGAVKDKDLEQLAAVKALGLRHLVSLDRHFEGFVEYATPKRFLESLGKKPRRTEY